MCINELSQPTNGLFHVSLHPSDVRNLLEVPTSLLDEELEDPVEELGKAYDEYFELLGMPHSDRGPEYEKALADASGVVSATKSLYAAQYVEELYFLSAKNESYTPLTPEFIIVRNALDTITQPCFRKD